MMMRNENDDEKYRLQMLATWFSNMNMGPPWLGDGAHDLREWWWGDLKRGELQWWLVPMEDHTYLKNRAKRRK
jgi:hypothetical protein